MSLIDDLKKLTPSYNHRISIGSVSITERNSNASVKKVTWENADFNNIDADLAKNASSFFIGCTSPEIFHKDCDGIFTFEYDGKKYMFLTELKSKFSTQELLSAKKQIISTFLKTNTILQLLQSYQIEDYIVKGFIISHPPKSDFMINLHQSSSLPKNSDKYVEYNLAYKLLYNQQHRIKLRPIDISSLKGLPLGPRGIFSEIELRFIEVPEENNSIILNIQNYI